jgi:hypothetical protein
VVTIDPGQVLACASWLTLASSQTNKRRRPVMFFDNVVIAGVLTVGLMVLFFAGLGIFIWKDSKKRKKRIGLFRVT